MHEWHNPHCIRTNAPKKIGTMQMNPKMLVALEGKLAAVEAKVEL